MEGGGATHVHIFLFIISGVFLLFVQFFSRIPYKIIVKRCTVLEIKILTYISSLMN